MNVKSMKYSTRLIISKYTGVNQWGGLCNHNTEIQENRDQVRAAHRPQDTVGAGWHHLPSLSGTDVGLLFPLFCLEIVEVCLYVVVAWEQEPAPGPLGPLVYFHLPGSAA